MENRLPVTTVASPAIPSPAPVVPETESENGEEERDYDSDDSEYIPEDDQFGIDSSSLIEEESPPESSQSHAERLKEAVNKLSPEIRTTLEEQLRGQFIQLRKFPRSRWI